MALPILDHEHWSNRVENALSGYAHELLRSVAQRLLRHRNHWPVEELTERIVATTGNAASIDRRLKELPIECRKVLAIITLSRKPTWKIGHLVSILAALGHAEGIAPIRTLFDEGLLFPDRPVPTPKLRTFEQWLGTENVANLSVFAHPAVSHRARSQDLEFTKLPAQKPHKNDIRESDGLEWPLRLALIWQQVNETPIRRTTSNEFYKRDLQRLNDDVLLNTPFVECAYAAPDAGPLSVLWAIQIGLLDASSSELRADSFPDIWSKEFTQCVVSLWQAFVEIAGWNPSAGLTTSETASSAFPAAHWLLLFLLASQPADHWLRVDDIAEWLVSHQPYWRPGDQAEVTAWLNVELFAILFQLKLLQCAPAAAGGWHLRLSPIGRWLAMGNGTPTPQPEFVQTLLVQANFEILVFRQALSPSMIASLSKFAKWKSFGSACQMEMIADQVYRGLEAGMSHDSIVQLLQRHGMRTLPENVADALRTWANKRERLIVYSDVTLLEFETPSELDAAASRGLIEAKLTDRIGLVRNEDKLDYRQLRLTGTRDFAAKPERCLHFLDDGVTFQVDAARSDLLLETELGNVAVELPEHDRTQRTYQLTRDSLRLALERGSTLATLDEWLTLRSGAPLSPAGRLLAAEETPSAFRVDHPIVVRTSSVEFADALLQLTATRSLIRERLGPTALAVDSEDLNSLSEQIELLGQRVDRNDTVSS